MSEIAPDAEVPAYPRGPQHWEADVLLSDGGAVHLRPGYRVGDQAVPRGGVPLESAAGER